MKISAGNADRFVASPDAAIVAVLVYGPDAGLVGERCARAVRSVVEDPSDPFRVAEISAGALKDDPARLSDEVSALSMTGGRRVVYLRGAAEGEAPALSALLDDGGFESFLVVEAGDLSPRSALRKLFEGAANGAAVACYADDAGSLKALIQEVMSSNSVFVEPDAMTYLSDNLGADRRVSRSELEKLAIFAGEGGQVTLADALACVGDSATATLDDIGFAVAGGDPAGLTKALERARADGLEDIAVLRAAQRHFQRLHLTVGRIGNGASSDQAIRSLRPPVFFKRVDGFRSQTSRWRAQDLEAALAILTDAEIACKSTGVPSNAACDRALLRLATRAARAGHPAR